MILEHKFIIKKPNLYDKKLLLSLLHFLLRTKIDDLNITLLLDDSQSEYITAVLWQGDRATIQEFL
ncbi:hypothetical protein QTO01_07050 [Vibrio mytili]|uniref:Uncharacterized protein n=1 Tax=Vibrio mytili TaxID=50718 RepID=A0A0C3I5X1_9VIBR|nr:hypothetical protein [Vibrio mytili]KIN10430.1 hypothetical protein SU60_12405 [Vibrio mytili]